MKIPPPGTKVSFKGDSYVYIVYGYHDGSSIIKKCEDPCHIHHGEDCYEEDYLVVNQITTRAFPLSTLKTVFDNQGYGHDPE